MSDTECSGAGGAGTGVAEVSQTNEATEKLTGEEQLAVLAGDDANSMSVDEEPQEPSETLRGTKRRLSAGNITDCDAAKRTSGEANDAQTATNVQDGSKKVFGNSGSDHSLPNDGVAVSKHIIDEKASKTPLDNGKTSKPEVGGASQKKAPDTVIEISDDSSDSSICAVDSYQASAAELKRIRGADYSSSSDYSSDSSSSCEDESVVLGGGAARRRAARRAQLNARAPRTEEPRLSAALTAADTLDKLSAHWAQGERLDDAAVTLTCEPFKVCQLRDILSNPEIINNIVDDMNTLDWSRKKMDLYEFHQTTDLANLTWQRSIRGIYDLLKDQLMPWVSRVTGLKLTHTSASCSLYGPGDHLLCHDDLLADRKVAFILYLAPWTLPPRRRGADDAEQESQVQDGWRSEMGGALELLACDERRRPTRVVHSLLPRNNTLAFFQVTPESFHQVSEVKSLEFPRLSINGWFHGPDAPGDVADADAATTAAPVALAPHKEIVLMSAWLTPQYLAPRTRLQIQQQMEKASEISLQHFLAPDKYRAVLEHLAAPDVEWEEAGPANQRRYDLLRPESLEPLDKEHALRELLKLFSSAAMYKFLQECTELAIRSHFHLEMQRWRANSFTVLPARESYAQNRLDAVMYLGFPERAVCGGITTYVAPEEADAPPLVSLEPKSNALNLVYADMHTARFTKHVSAMTMRPDECFYIIACSYKEEQP